MAQRKNRTNVFRGGTIAGAVSDVTSLCFFSSSPEDSLSVLV